MAALSWAGQPVRLSGWMIPLALLVVGWWCEGIAGHAVKGSNRRIYPVAGEERPGRRVPAGM